MSTCLCRGSVQTEGAVCEEEEKNRLTERRGKCTFQMSPCPATLYAERKNGVKIEDQGKIAGEEKKKEHDSTRSISFRKKPALSGMLVWFYHILMYSILSYGLLNFLFSSLSSNQINIYFQCLSHKISLEWKVTPGHIS